jgi:hydroxymethylglutaryl-CoA synthase
MAGVAAYGVWLPRLRLARRTLADAVGWVNTGLKNAKGERTLANWDEDALTMAVEAARDALPSADSRASIRSVLFASTTLPFADRSNATLLASALGLADDVMTLDVTGSQHAGTSAMLQGCLSVTRGKTLVVAADKRLARPGSEQESSYGHGAAALVIDSGPGVAQVLGHEHVATDFVDHYRLTDQPFDYTLEERWIREAGWQQFVPKAVAQLLATTGITAKDIDHLIIPAPKALSRKLAADCGIDVSRCVDALEDQCGHIGVGHALLMLAGALERAQPGERMLLIGFGQGVDAILLHTTAEVAQFRPGQGLTQSLADKRMEPSYIRFLAHCGILQMDFGMRAERDTRTAHTVAWRRHAEILTLTAGRCPHCHTVQYPKAKVCVAPDCRRPGDQTPVSLADMAGRIKTFTEDWLAYSPRPPLMYGNVSFEGGGNVFIELADFEPGEPAVGTATRCVFRLKDVDRIRGFRRYFWKAAPVPSRQLASTPDVATAGDR